jgi:hypothetical protein
MYKEHPSFKAPLSPSDKVWRYMDFTKFLSLLESRSLYFTRADKFEDPFEGSYPKANVLSRLLVPNEVPLEHREKFMQAMSGLADSNRQWPRYTAINCWHLNNHESAAMWRLYLKSNEGIAIQTTFQKLRDSFSITQDDIYLGQVSYIDYEIDWFESGNILNPFVHKRKSFEHEKEVRAVVMKWPTDPFDFAKDTIGQGLLIPVDMNILVEKIYVSPDAPSWFASLVRSVVGRYNLNYEVTQSDLNQQPLY